MNKITEIFRGVLSAIGRIIRGFFALFYEEQKAQPPTQQKDGQLPPIQPLQREVARPTELGISSADAPKYQKSRSLLSPSEHILHDALLRANNDEYVIHPKVRMGDFVYLANEPQDRKFHVNQVICKHVDFLFCDKRNLEPLLVVELDDSSHKQYVQTERDEFKNRAFAAIELPYLRIPIQQEYDWKSLQVQIKEKLARK